MITDADKAAVIEALRAMKEKVLAKDGAALLASYEIAYKYKPDNLEMYKAGITSADADEQKTFFELAEQAFTSINFDALFTDAKVSFIDHPAKTDYEAVVAFVIPVTIAATTIQEPVFEPGTKSEVKISVVKLNGAWYVGAPSLDVLKA